MSSPSLIAVLLLLVACAVAAACDLRTGEIPNRLVATGALACAAANLVSGAAAGGGTGVLRALLTAAAGLVLTSLVPFLLFRSGGMGGGDVKLLAMVGIALGPYAGIQGELYAFVAAAIYAPTRLIWEGKLGRAMKTTGALVLRPLLPRARRPAPLAAEELTELRFAPAIFLGVTLAAMQLLGAGR